MIKETSAGIVLFRKENSNNLFLLLHYPSGHWDFVKGKMEKNESTHETAIRETKEETGITKFTFLENFEEWIEYNFQWKGELVQKKVVFFLAETKTKEVEISHEHLNYKWVDYKDAMEKTTFDNAKTVLTKAQMLLS
ncbi:MAG: RNA pyrophosphohydrolase [Nitrosopumilus sp.]|nr:RNA pyrophosphohydrolase [Nitrosopumilus sp.]